MKAERLNVVFVILLAISQIAAIIFYSVFYRHVLPTEPNADALSKLNLYGFFQDVHIMVFVGIGFILASFHKFRLSILMVFFWLAALTVQYYFLFRAFWAGVFLNQWGSINIDTAKLILGDVCAGSILIGICAIIGKASQAQLLSAGVLGACAYACNEVVVAKVLDCRDTGGALLMHLFGGAYGIGLALVYRYKDSSKNKNLFDTHNSLTFATMGCLFLWCFWPSINSAMAGTESAILLSVLNTYFAMIGSVLSAFGTSVILRGGKFAMAHVLNASLAGGVIIGSSVDILYDGWAAYLLGSLSGIVTVMSMEYWPRVSSKIGLHDVAGVFNLHVLPGILAGFASAACRAKWIDNGAGKQIAGTFVTVAIALTAGILVGLLTKGLHSFQTDNDFFNDKPVVALEDYIVEELSVYGKYSYQQEIKIPAVKGGQRQKQDKIRTDSDLVRVVDKNGATSTHRQSFTNKVHPHMSLPIETEKALPVDTERELSGAQVC